MSTLSDQEVVKIAKGVAAANNVSVDQVLTALAWDSTGASAIEIKYVLLPVSIVSWLTTSHLETSRSTKQR